MKRPEPKGQTEEHDGEPAQQAARARVCEEGEHAPQHSEEHAPPGEEAAHCFTGQTEVDAWA